MQGSPRMTALGLPFPKLWIHRGAVAIRRGQSTRAVKSGKMLGTLGLGAGGLRLLKPLPRGKAATSGGGGASLLGLCC